MNIFTYTKLNWLIIPVNCLTVTLTIIFFNFNRIQVTALVLTFIMVLI